MSRYEIKLDLSRSTEDKFDTIIAELVKNGYEVYLTSDSYDNYNNKKELCLSIMDDDVTKLKDEI